MFLCGITDIMNPHVLRFTRLVLEDCHDYFACGYCPVSEESRHWTNSITASVGARLSILTALLDTLSQSIKSISLPRETRRTVLDQPGTHST